MSISLFEEGEWKGVEISWIGEIQQTNRGAKSTLRYLTSPGCPIILVDFLIENTTLAPMRFYPCITTYPSFDGKIDDYVLSARWGEELVRIRPSPIPTAMMPMTNFVKFESGEDGLGIIVPLKERRSIVLAISELVIAGPFDFTTWLLPGESTRLPTSQ